MNLEMALAIMRTGYGRIRPIIEYYAKTGEELELIPYLDEGDICRSVLYVLSELPRVDQKAVDVIKRKLEVGEIAEAARPWAEDIVFNHG